VARSGVAKKAKLESPFVWGQNKIPQIDN